MRMMIKSLAGSLVGVLALFSVACSAQDSGKTFEEGVQYKKVRKVQPPKDPKRIEVNEFFWYGCPHCYDFEPTITPWAKTLPGDVDFVRIPNSLGHPRGVMHIRMYYAAQQLKLLDKLHPLLFDALQNQHRQLATEAEIADFFSAQAGVMPDVVTATLKGFSVDMQTRKAQELAMEYGVTSVPMLVVGGKYVTSPAMAKGFRETTQVVDFLIDKVRKERAGK